MTQAERDRVTRVLAHLIRNEQVSADAVDRAVGSSIEMGPGSLPHLTGVGKGDEIMRRDFLAVQVGRIESNQR